MRIKYARNMENRRSSIYEYLSVFKSFRGSLRRKNDIPSLTELIDTERSYIKNLETIIHGFIAELRNPESPIKPPEDLRGLKGSLVFANIKEIYKWHKEYFLNCLIECLGNHAHLAKTFKENTKGFNVYIDYCNNKDKSQYIVRNNKEYFEKVRIQLGLKLALNDLLIQPVQRVQQYNLILEKIYKEFDKQNLHELLPGLRDAMDCMVKVCEDINNITIANDITDFPESITSQGKLLLHGEFRCFNSDKMFQMFQMPKYFYVFLFEKIILFTKKRDSQYKYHLYIPLNKLQMERVDGAMLFKSSDPNCLETSIVCYTEPKVLYHKWQNTIKQQLERVAEFMKIIENPDRDFQEKLC